jgi:hypothetical protein
MLKIKYFELAYCTLYETGKISQQWTDDLKSSVIPNTEHTHCILMTIGFGH